jgi:hypothetical protein
MDATQLLIDRQPSLLEEEGKKVGLHQMSRFHHHIFNVLRWI